ncbi:hypothetical protein H7673_10905, partial [Streptococcus dysgalactiae subsp. equisimilis]|nr:hypothetical protein [Streptococcus dysgalactiae subsp. equisimilis]
MPPNERFLSKWSHLDGIAFTPFPDSKVSILIGLDAPDAHWILEQRRGKKKDPYVDRTPLGGVLRGLLVGV